MEILHTETEVLTVERTTLQMPDGSIVRVLEYTDSNGKVVDSIVRDKDGYEIDDMHLIDEVYDFLDAQIPVEDDGPEYDGAGFTYDDRVVDGQYKNDEKQSRINTEKQ
jgi:hypothetical protein